MEIRLLTPAEVPQAAVLSKMVYGACLEPMVASEQMKNFFYEYMNTETLAAQVSAGNLTIWGACEGVNLVGVSAMRRDGLITMFYVHPSWQRRRIGKKLLETMRRYARIELNLRTVRVNASPARTFRYFMKNGFLQTNIQQDEFSPFMEMYANSLYIRDYEKRSLKPGVIAGVLGGFTAAAVLSGVLYNLIR